MIREFERSDIEDVIRIWKAAHGQSHGFVDPDSWLPLEREMRELRIPGLSTFVYADPRIKGFIAMYLDGSAVSAWGDIDGLYVDPLVQGQGVGRALLDYAKSRARRLTLQVFEQNPRAVQFYSREGFTTYENIIDCGTGEPCVRMIWRIDSDA